MHAADDVDTQSAALLEARAALEALLATRSGTAQTERAAFVTALSRVGRAGELKKRAAEWLPRWLETIRRGYVTRAASDVPEIRERIVKSGADQLFPLIDLELERLAELSRRQGTKGD